MDDLLGRLGRGLTWAACFCLVVMMGQIVVDVTGRYLLAQPLPSTLEIVSEWWMPALIFLPLLDVEWRQENIAVDILYQRLGPRRQAGLQAFAYLCFGAFVLLSAYGAGEQALRAARQGEFIVGTVPVVTWPPRFFLPLAGALTAALTLVRAARALRRALWGDGTDASPGVHSSS
ncbi:MAG: TRAP transporter small permease subunit [Kiloniellaceae bacterium]